MLVRNRTFIKFPALSFQKPQGVIPVAHHPVIPVRDTGIYLVFIMDIILTYAPRICYSLHDFQIFLYLDPSVTHWDDTGRGAWMTGKSDNQIAFEIQRSYSCVSATRMTSIRNLLKQWLCIGSNVFAMLFMLFLSSFVSAEEFQPLPNKKMDWKFDGITGSFDRESIQRGYKVYKEVCAACHSMNRVAFRNLQDIGFSEEDVKQIAASYQVKAGPNDLGEMFDRPGIPSDNFIAPFDVKEAAAAANNGAVPPDLSLIVKARHDGANYVYSLLTGYKGDEQDESGLYINPYFPTGKLAMAPPLSEGLLEYDGDREATVENMAYDVTNFLQWAAEPEMERRHKLGLKVVAYFVILTVFFVLTNKKVWSTLYKKKK